MFSRRIAVCLLFLSVSGAHAAGAASILDLSRTAIASTFIDASGVFTDDEAVPFLSESTGPFLEAAVSSLGFGDVTVANAEALHDSVVFVQPGGFRSDGGATVAASFDVLDPGFRSRAVGAAESGVSILFDVPEPSEITLAVALSAELNQLQIFSGAGPVEALLRASATLTGANTGVVVTLVVEDDMADGQATTDGFTFAGVLAPDTYRLEISAIAELRGFEDAAGLGAAGFGYDFVVVPEPATGLLLGLALIAISGPRTRSRRRAV